MAPIGAVSLAIDRLDGSRPGGLIDRRLIAECLDILAQDVVYQPVLQKGQNRRSRVQFAALQSSSQVGHLLRQVGMKCQMAIEVGVAPLSIEPAFEGEVVTSVSSQIVDERRQHPGGAPGGHGFLKIPYLENQETMLPVDFVGPDTVTRVPPDEESIEVLHMLHARRGITPRSTCLQQFRGRACRRSRSARHR